MSFLSERLVRAAGPATRAITAHSRARAFSSTATLYKTPTESVKDGLKSVDRAVSDNIVIPGLDAAAKAKDAAQNMTKGDAKVKAQEVKGHAQEMTGQAKGSANEMAGKAKGAANEMAGKAKGTAEEVKSKM